MSAANRGGDRIAADNYPTPSWCTRRILEALRIENSIGTRPMQVIEPCCGEGAIVREVKRRYPTANVDGYDIRDVREAAEAAGALFDPADATQPLIEATLSGGVYTDLLITNPPFSLAAEIILAQRNTARVAAYLLRSSFKLQGELKSGEQYSFREDMPDVYQLPERPSFNASDRCVDSTYDGIDFVSCGWGQKVALTTPRPHACPECGNRVTRSSSDASEYAWFVWGSHRSPSGQLWLLPSTPLAERKEIA